jgi:thioredoxin 1
MFNAFCRHARFALLIAVGTAGLLVSCGRKEVAESSTPSQSEERVSGGDKSSITQTNEHSLRPTDRNGARFVTLTEKNFAETVLKSPQPFLVDFWAEWCGPCKMLSPVLEELAADHGKDVRFGKLNVDEQGAIAAKYGIRAIPTLLLFQDGKIAETVIGLRSKKDLSALITKHYSRSPN